VENFRNSEIGSRIPNSAPPRNWNPKSEFPTKFAWDISMPLPCTLKVWTTLAVIILVDFQQVDKNSLNITGLFKSQQFQQLSIMNLTLHWVEDDDSALGKRIISYFRTQAYGWIFLSRYFSQTLISLYLFFVSKIEVYFFLAVYPFRRT
jgi:hypothetical protein